MRRQICPFISSVFKLFFFVLTCVFALPNNGNCSFEEAGSYGTIAIESEYGDEVPWHRLGGAEVEEELILKSREEREKNIEYLQMAKIGLITGNWEMADHNLSKITGKGSSKKIADRYLALLRFIQGKYQASVDIIEPNILNSSTFLKENCLIYQMSLLALFDRARLPLVWQTCRRELTKDPAHDYLFMDALYGVVTNDEFFGGNGFLRSSAPFMQSEEQIKVWLKMGLILGKEELMEPELTELGQHSYFKDKIRELVAITLFRLGKQEEALKFIEDVQTPNAENLRAIVLLKDKQWELAYAHFQGALKIKENSLQAMNRALPLAWLLHQDQSGYDLSKRIPSMNDDRQSKELIEAVFLNRLGRIEESSTKLTKIIETKGHRSNSMVRSLELLNEMLLGKKGMAKRLARENCQQADALSCWLLLHLIQWENFPRVLQRPNSNLEMGDWVSLDELLDNKSKGKIREQALIEQSRLDEMDLGSFHLDNDLAPYRQQDLFNPGK